MSGIFWPAEKVLALKKKEFRSKVFVSKLKNITRIFIFAQFIYLPESMPLRSTR